MRLSVNESNELMLPGFRSLSRNEPRSLISSEGNVDRVGESSEALVGCILCKSLLSKNGSVSSNMSDFGLAIAPLTASASSP